MPHRLIGRTAGFGPVSRGSSPRGATKTSLSRKREAFLFLLSAGLLACWSKNTKSWLPQAGLPLGTMPIAVGPLKVILVGQQSTTLTVVLFLFKTFAFAVVAGKFRVLLGRIYTTPNIGERCCTVLFLILSWYLWGKRVSKNGKNQIILHLQSEK